ncbi:MAG: UvrD-helicase domain-containing protein [Chitinophagaceae bacterium]
MDFLGFVNGAKTKLVSPAGYGKTFTIVECLKHTEGKQLILTHTHAGIGSIKEKIRNADIESTKYTIETISSFAQQFVHAYCRKSDIPPQDKAREYHTFITERVARVLSSSLAQQAIAASYKGLFVDEYQDCSKGQHIIIQLLSKVLPTHILGDPLQGIFDFNGDKVDMDTDLPDFTQFPDLDTPHRWYKDGNNKALGDVLKDYRELLLQKKPIILTGDNSIGLHIISINDGDLYDSTSTYRKKLDSIINNKTNLEGMDSLLILVPEYDDVVDGKKVSKGSIVQRAKLRDQIDYAKKLSLLEAIDDKLFYSLAKDADELLKSIGRARKKYKKIKESILDKLFQASKLSQWFNGEGLISKKSPADKETSEKIRMPLDIFIKTPSALHLFNVVDKLRKYLKLKYKREEVGRSFANSLQQSHLNNISIYDAIKDNRNLIRRTGRKVNGRCIGTTLLTKGLEFDTVVLMDAHRFDSPNHLYVALTRCCKRLIIFTATSTLSPY